MVNQTCITSVVCVMYSRTNFMYQQFSAFVFFFVLFVCYINLCFTVYIFSVVFFKAVLLVEVSGTLYLTLSPLFCFFWKTHEKRMKSFMCHSPHTSQSIVLTVCLIRLFPFRLHVCVYALYMLCNLIECIFFFFVVCWFFSFLYISAFLLYKNIKSLWKL